MCVRVHYLACMLAKSEEMYYMCPFRFAWTRYRQANFSFTNVPPVWNHEPMCLSRLPVIPRVQLNQMRGENVWV